VVHCRYLLHQHHSTYPTPTPQQSTTGPRNISVGFTERVTKSHLYSASMFDVHASAAGAPVWLAPARHMPGADGSGCIQGGPSGPGAEAISLSSSDIPESRIRQLDGYPRNRRRPCSTQAFTTKLWRRLTSTCRSSLGHPTSSSGSVRPRLPPRSGSS
jgi:hypothetical protein